MRTLTKSWMAALTVVMFALLLASSTASALSSIEIRGAEGGATASGPLTFSSGAGREIICSVTLLRTISRAFPKIERILIGRITGVAIDYGERHCRSTEAGWVINKIIALRNASRETLERDCPEIRAGSPIHLCDVSGSAAELWKLIYRSFTGTLPGITGINFDIGDVQFKIEFNPNVGFLLRCLYRGTISSRVEVEGGEIRRGSGSGTLTLFKDLLLGCPREPTLAGNLTVSPALRIALL